jgi:peptidoglycan/LPS O-acetylase OafA/YrhL
VALFERIFDRASASLSFLSRSIYSVYLSHFTFIYLFGYIFAFLEFEGAALYGLVVATALPASVIFHLLIERSATLLFLFNGRLPAGVQTVPVSPGGLALQNATADPPARA